MPAITTFEDALASLMDTFNLRFIEDQTPSGREMRMARGAILEAYREFPDVHPWDYFQRPFTVTTEASYSTGTIAYDDTGGTYEREVTLTGGTWPANAEHGILFINDIRYEIDARKSDTVVTLNANNNPGSDIAAGTTYQWARAVYPVGGVFRRAGKLIESSNEWELVYVSPERMNIVMANSDVPTRPSFYTYRGDDGYPNQIVVEFGPAPDSAVTYDTIAEFIPRPLTLTVPYKTGTVEGSINTSTITGTGTSWTADMVGAVIRLPRAGWLDKVPEPLSGEYPYRRQYTIKTVDSATSLTIDGTLPETYAALTKYTISDPLDLEPGAMMNFFQRLCEMKYAGLCQSDRYERFRGREQMAYETAIAAAERHRGYVAGDSDAFPRDLAHINVNFVDI